MLDWLTGKGDPTFWKTYLEHFEKEAPNTPTRYVIFDCESTGLDWKQDVILSIGCVGVTNDQIEINDFFEVFIKHESRIHRNEVIEKLFSGELAPLTFFPLFLQTIAFYLPFKYLAHFPSQIYLEKISYSEILKNFLGAFCWIAALIIIIIIVWKRGLKRYDGSSI